MLLAVGDGSVGAEVGDVPVTVPPAPAVRCTVEGDGLGQADESVLIDAGRDHDLDPAGEALVADDFDGVVDGLGFHGVLLLPRFCWQLAFLAPTGLLALDGRAPTDFDSAGYIPKLDQGLRR